ncbi:copper resistance CopC family protein [Isoptericola cucumis]|uniref:copper resistance CopC family protein n=1 Tax=Isoptericola cucumis TaxID=1776856 RepID=UPI0032088F20
MRRGLTAGLTAVLGAVAAAALAAPASAHNVVVDTTPGTGSTVAEAPSEVSVTFDDVVLELGADGSSTVVQVTGEDGREHATGCPTMADRTVSVPVSLDDPGEYTVAWRIVSADGHPTSGEFSFTYAPADGAAPQDASAEPGASDAQAGCGAGEGDQAAGDDQPEAAGADAAGAGSSDLPVALGIAGGVVVLAGAGVLVALRVSRRRG